MKWVDKVIMPDRGRWYKGVSSFPFLALALLLALAIQGIPADFLSQARHNVASARILTPDQPHRTESSQEGIASPKRSNTPPSPPAGSNREECLGCHRITTPRIAKEHEQGVHAEADLGCAGCHGGDAGAKEQNVAHSLQKGYKGQIPLKEILSLCGNCHADIERMRPYRLDADVYREYLSSRHGKLFAQGDLKVALCTSCHGVHLILSRKDPHSPTSKQKIPETCGRCHADKELMRPYGIPTEQVVQYREGIHGRILFGELPGKDPTLVPTCVDCHGGHGAVPPDLKTVHAICGTCHFYEYQYFKKGPHYESVRVAKSPKCIDCHGNHRNTIPAEGLLIGKEKGSCGSCHKQGDQGYRVALELKEILGRAERLRANFQKAIATQTADTTAALFLKGEDAKLQSELSALKKVTHAVDPQEAREKLAELEGTARSALLYWQKVLSQKEKGIGPLLLVLGGVTAGVGLLSLATALLILRWKGRERGGTGRT